MAELYATSKGYDNINPKIIATMRLKIKARAKKMWKDHDC